VHDSEAVYCLWHVSVEIKFSAAAGRFKKMTSNLIFRAQKNLLASLHQILHIKVNEPE
jgi:hypothetical protein